MGPGVLDGGGVTAGVRLGLAVGVLVTVGVAVTVAGGTNDGRAVISAAANNSAAMKPRRPRFVRKN